MRISVKNSDPGYFEGSYRCSVYLDGVKLDDCVTADEEEGLAICYDMAAARAGLASASGSPAARSRRPRTERRPMSHGFASRPCSRSTAPADEPALLRLPRLRVHGAGLAIEEALRRAVNSVATNRGAYR